MNTFLLRLSSLKGSSAQAAIPVLVLLILVMMLVPLPTLLLDVLFTFNIGLSIMVLMAALNIRNFKDFISFPTLLLLTTFLFAVVCRYAVRYMNGDPGQPRFMLWLCLTGACVFVLILAHNLLLFALACLYFGFLPGWQVALFHVPMLPTHAR